MPNPVAFSVPDFEQNIACKPVKCVLVFHRLCTLQESLGEKSSLFSFFDFCRYSCLFALSTALISFNSMTAH